MMKPLQHEHFDWRNLMLDSDLPFHSKAVALFLHTYMNAQQQIAWPSQATIIGRLGIPKSTLNKYLNVLEDQGWITRERGDWSKSTRYFTTYPQGITDIIGSPPEELSSPPAGLCPPDALGSPPDGQRLSTSGTKVVHQRDTNSILNNTENNTSNRGGSDPVSGKPKTSIPYSSIVDLYHTKLPTLPECRKLTTKRKGQIKQRWLSGDLPSLEVWDDYFDYVSESNFLTGKVAPMNGRKPFMADIEWLTNETNYTKVYEGKYHG